MYSLWRTVGYHAKVNGQQLLVIVQFAVQILLLHVNYLCIKIYPSKHTIKYEWIKNYYAKKGGHIREKYKDYDCVSLSDHILLKSNDVYQSNKIKKNIRITDILQKITSYRRDLYSCNANTFSQVAINISLYEQMLHWIFFVTILNFQQVERRPKLEWFINAIELSHKLHRGLSGQEATVEWRQTVMAILLSNDILHLWL